MGIDTVLIVLVGLDRCSYRAVPSMYVVFVFSDNLQYVLNTVVPLAVVPLAVVPLRVEQVELLVHF